MLRNPITGETFEWIKAGEDTGGRYCELMYGLEPGGSAPAAHVHPGQVERFEVLQGELTILVAGQEHVVRPGEVITIETGMGHQPKNTGGEMVRARVRFEPAHPMGAERAFYETYCGYASAGRAGRDGTPPLLAMAVLLDRFPGFIYLAGLPVWLQRPLLKLLARVGKASGFRVFHPDEAVGV